MAAITKSQITVNEVWNEGGSTSRKFKAVDVTLNLTNQGATAGDIPASAFGLTKVRDVRAVRDSMDTGNFWLYPSYNGLTVYATDQGTVGPVNVTAIIRMIIVGT